MKFKLDENLSPSLAEMFAAAGHDAHSVAQEALGGQPDARIIEVRTREQRALVTLDLDFSNILAYPPAKFAGIAVLRLADQAHVTVEGAIRRMLDLLSKEPVAGTLGSSRIAASAFVDDAHLKPGFRTSWRSCSSWSRADADVQGALRSAQQPSLEWSG